MFIDSAFGVVVVLLVFIGLMAASAGFAAYFLSGLNVDRSSGQRKSIAVAVGLPVGILVPFLVFAADTLDSSFYTG